MLAQSFTGLLWLPAPPQRPPPLQGPSQTPSHSGLAMPTLPVAKGRPRGETCREVGLAYPNHGLKGGAKSPTWTPQTMARKGPGPSRHLKQGARARILEAQLKRGWEIEAQSSRYSVCVGGGVGGQREKRKKTPAQLYRDQASSCATVFKE